MREGGEGALLKRNGTALIVCLVGAASVVGFAAGFGARTEPPLPDRAQPSAAETVNSRFPVDWPAMKANEPAPVALASADVSFLLDPSPTYPIGTEQLPPWAEVEAPSQAEPPPAVPAKPVAAVRRPVHRSNAVLNDSQIASIRQRLKLTPEQQRYWPAVEAELRKMEYRKDPSAPQGQRTVNVEGLKSAGAPLVMSFNDDQRAELKSLAHLLGLDSVISSN